MNGLSLFSGIGGLDLAFQWAGGNILAFCEIDTYCQKVLAKHWPDIPIFNDIHNLNKDVLRNEGILQTVDVIYGGFPCQPFSLAGNKKGKDDTRYLWPEFSRLVREIRPRWVVAENVPGILSIAADTVCSDLEREGYSVGIWDFEAASVGAKHRRERVFFIAHSRRTLRQRSAVAGTFQKKHDVGKATQLERPNSPHVHKATTNSDCERRKEQRQPFPQQQALAGTEWCGRRLAESRICGGINGFPRALDGSVSPVCKGMPNRKERLRALGNAVVPQQAYPVFFAVMEADGT